MFDIWDLLLSEMEDTIAEGFKGRRQLPYAHWITFLILKTVQVRTPEMVAEYKDATTEFPAYNMAQRIRHSTPQAPTQPHRHPDVPEFTAQQDEIIRNIVATEEEELEAQEERSESSDSSDDHYLSIPHMPPCRHGVEAGSSSSAPPAPQMDPALIAILEQMQQDQTRQAQETATNFAQF